MPRHSASATRPVGRPRKKPSDRKRGISVTLNPLTVKKMDAVRQIHEKNSFYPPTDSWMVEKGLEEYFQAELVRFPQLQKLFDEIQRASAVIASIHQSPAGDDRQAGKGHVGPRDA